jgi:uncharacterized membrane protein
MPIGIILLLVIAVLIYFGLLHRVLDRMHMNDRTAIIFIGAMVVGTFIPNIPLGAGLSINLGGGLVPIAIAIYLIMTADNSAEKIRAISASIITGIAIYTAGKLLPEEPESMFIDPLIAFSVIAGIIAYVFGRSRRGAFVAGILGIVISDIISAVGIVDRPVGTAIGGAGILDAVVISGVIAVALCEVTGEAREKMQGGTEKAKAKPGTEMTSMLVSDDEDEPVGGEEKNDQKDKI